MLCIIADFAALITSVSISLLCFVITVTDIHFIM